MKKGFLLLVFTFLLLAAAGCATSPDEGKRIAPELGAIAPAFTLENLDGEEVSLVDQRGTVVLINFWATWCPPCRQEMPGIQSRYARHQPELVVLAVDAGDPAGDVQEFFDELGLTFTPLLDPTQEIVDLYRIANFPTSMFVDENGVIQIIHIGFMTEGQLDGYLAQMGLGEQTASQ